MSLKRLINEQRILQSGAVDMEVDLPGEPLAYSIKYPVGQRTRNANFFRNAKWASLLKCYLRAYLFTKTPVVVFVRFYVSPPSNVKIKASDLKKESIPAVLAYEVCDYTLSFLEMLHHTLINSYRQIVKLDVEKYYSNNPRTVFQFMKWDHYVHLCNTNTVHPEAKSKCKIDSQSFLQSFSEGDEADAGSCGATITRELPKHEAVKGTAPSDSPLQTDSSPFTSYKKTSTAKQLTPQESARRRQSGEVLE